MYKFVFELLKEPLGLPISPLYEYLILLVINEIAFRIAWNASPGGKWGSEIHWLVRIPTFLIMWAITYTLIFIIKWIIANWILIAFVLLGVSITIGIVFLLIHKKRVEVTHKQ